MNTSFSSTSHQTFKNTKNQSSIIDLDWSLRVSLTNVVNCSDGWALLVNFIGIPMKLEYSKLLFFFTVMQFFG